MNPDGLAALDPCVHCGFCLQACPTYLATGDESDSPRGRIVLMRALARGEISPRDPALREHLDLCLGCLGCEPVCPAGVGYGHGLQAARERLAAANGIPLRARVLLAGFRRESRWRPLLTAARWLRDTGLPGRLAGSGRIGFGMGMLAASGASAVLPAPLPRPHSPAKPPHRPTVALLTGCVMSTLFKRVNRATSRVLEANGYHVVEVSGQTCCGALHEHAGDRETARDLLTRNATAFAGRCDLIVVNSAGCGAHLRHAGRFDGKAGDELATRVRDVTELLADAGPRPGAPLPLQVAYDAPCHLEHAQSVREPPLKVLAAIPGLELRRLPGSDRCCGSAGIYSLIHPEMSRAVLDDKIREIAGANPRPDVVTTGNPGCLMQIGAGLRAARLPVAVAHPVELLDRSYQLAGHYD